MTWLRRANAGERFYRTGGTMTPPPAMVGSISAWVRSVMAADVALAELRSRVSDMGELYGERLLRMANELVGMVESGRTWDEVSVELDDTVDWVREQAAAGSDGMADLADGLVALEEAVLDAYASSGGASLEPAIPAGESYRAEWFDADFTGWAYEDAYERALVSNPGRREYAETVFGRVLVGIVDGKKSAGGIGRNSETGEAAIQLKPGHVDGMLGTLEHELVHFTQYVMNYILHGDVPDSEWTFGMPPRKMRDRGMSQRDEGGVHALDDVEFHANLMKAVAGARDAMEDMDWYGRRAFMRSLLFGDAPSPSLTDYSARILEWIRRSLGLASLRESNAAKWKRAADELAKLVGPPED